MMSTPQADQERKPRKTIVRDVLIFQVKLWLEGFKDIVLMPLSLGAALLDLVFRGGMLYSVMKLGDRFEEWVQLYAALEDIPNRPERGRQTPSLDALLNEAADGIEKRASNGGDDWNGRTRPRS